jgi:hypothetical protein
VQRHVGGRLLQRLHVGVDGEELDALDLRLDHAVDRVDAGAADADDPQRRVPDRAGLAEGRRGRRGLARVRVGLEDRSGRHRLRGPGGPRGRRELRLGGAVGGSCRGGAMTFSGMSEENAWRRRSCGLGMRAGSGSGSRGDG